MSTAYQLKEAFPVTSESSDEDSWNRDLIDLAIDHGRAVRFQYPSHGEVAERICEPTNLVKNRAGDTLVICEGLGGDIIRSYRLDRIVGLVSA